MSKQMINHRGKQFSTLIDRVTPKLKRVFKTKNDLFILTSSGTGGMEAAVVNFLSSEDKVLAASIGAFGDRFADIAEKYGAEVRRIQKLWGTVVNPKELELELKLHPEIKAVLITHNETSTGVTNDLESCAAVVRKFDKLLIVDAVSSLSAIPVETDKWGLDVVVSGSQKGWMVPPGLAFISVSKKAWVAHAEAKMPRFYFDISKARTSLEKHQTSFTPNISALFALDVALDMILKEGTRSIFSRHKKIAKRLRKGVKQLGLEVFAKNGFESDTVTAIKIPSEIDARQLRQILEDEYDIVVAGGQAKLSGKVIRIGHLGLVTEDDIDDVLMSIKSILESIKSV